MVGRPADEKLTITTKHENRMARRFTLGLPGLILGAVLGGISALIVGIVRGVWNFLLDSTRSFVEAYVTVTNLGLIGSKNKLSIPTKHKDRMARRFTLGLPGLILGAVLGGISALIVGIARGAWNWLLNTARSAKQTFAMFANFALPADKQIDLPGIWAENHYQSKNI